MVSQYPDTMMMEGVPEEEHQQQQRPARSLQVVNQTHVDILLLLLLLGVVIRSVMVCTGTSSRDCILLSTANKNILRGIKNKILLYFCTLR